MKTDDPMYLVAVRNVQAGRQGDSDLAFLRGESSQPRDSKTLSLVKCDGTSCLDSKTFKATVKHMELFYTPVQLKIDLECLDASCPHQREYIRKLAKALIQTWGTQSYPGYAEVEDTARTPKRILDARATAFPEQDSKRRAKLSNSKTYGYARKADVPVIPGRDIKVCASCDHWFAAAPRQAKCFDCVPKADQLQRIRKGVA